MSFEGYFADEDPYLADGANVLRNLPKITDPKALEAFEAFSVIQRSEEPFPSGAYDAAHFRAIHHHLFRDVYDWAVEPRSIRIFKDGSPFCYQRASIWSSPNSSAGWPTEIS